MIIYKCDVCLKETARQDLCVLRIEKEKPDTGVIGGYSFVPVMPAVELCVFCKERVRVWLSDLQGSGEKIIHKCDVCLED